MSQCVDCGKEIDRGRYCEACQSKSLFLDQGSALPDCFDWEIPRPNPPAPPTAGKRRRG